MIDFNGYLVHCLSLHCSDIRVMAEVFPLSKVPSFKTPERREQRETTPERLQATALSALTVLPGSPVTG